MRLTISYISNLSLQFTGVVLLALHGSASECGDLGIIDWAPEDIPAGIDSKDLRKCQGHPEDSVTPKRGTGILGRRYPDRTPDCYPADDEYNCSLDGYCWKKCAPNGLPNNRGNWCWMAQHGGYAEWTTCKTATDCHYQSDFGRADCALGQGYQGCVDCRCTVWGSNCE